MATRQVTSITLADTYLTFSLYKHMRGRAISMVSDSRYQKFIEVRIGEMILTIDSFDSRTSDHRGPGILLRREVMDCLRTVDNSRKSISATISNYMFYL